MWKLEHWNIAYHQILLTFRSNTHPLFLMRLEETPALAKAGEASQLY